MEIISHTSILRQLGTERTESTSPAVSVQTLGGPVGLLPAGPGNKTTSNGVLTTNVLCPSDIATFLPSKTDGLPHASPSLVTPTHNSASEAKSLIYPDVPYGYLSSFSQWETRQTVHGSCPNARMVKITCDAHGTARWRVVPCKRRDCPVCGPVSRFRIAQRITNGIVKFGMVPELQDFKVVTWHYLCAWLVLTFPYDADKKEGVKRLGDFIRWLRKRLKRKLDYVATYEKTKNGRLHINLLIGTWADIPQKELQKRWGARLWISWVRDDQRMGTEASAASLGGYIAKVEQAVSEGRRVSYSKGWPKFEAIVKERRGIIHSWSTYAHDFEHRLNFGELIAFEYEKKAGVWEEVMPGEFKVRGPES